MVAQDSGMVTGTVGWDSRSLGSQAVMIGQLGGVLRGNYLGWEYLASPLGNPV